MLLPLLDKTIVVHLITAKMVGAAMIYLQTNSVSYAVVASVVKMTFKKNLHSQSCLQWPIEQKPHLALFAF